MDLKKEIVLLDFPKKIVTAGEIVTRVLSSLSDIVYLGEWFLEEQRTKVATALEEAWKDVTQNELPLNNALEIFSKYNFNNEDEIFQMIIGLPNPELLKEKGCPKEFIDKARKWHDEYYTAFLILSVQDKLNLNKMKILNYLEALEFDGTLKSKGGWQDVDTKFIIESWEKIDKLFGIGTVPPEIIEKYKKTAEEVKTGGKDLLIYLYFNLGYKPKEIAIMLGLSPEYENNIYNRKEKGKKAALELGLPNLEEYRKQRTIVIS